MEKERPIFFLERSKGFVHYARALLEGDLVATRFDIQRVVQMVMRRLTFIVAADFPYHARAQQRTMILELVVFFGYIEKVLLFSIPERHTIQTVNGPKAQPPLVIRDDGNL